MSKYISPSELSKHVKKMQGDTSDTAFAAAHGITRQGMVRIRAGEAIPNVRTRAKLGLELCYKVVEPVNTDAAAPVPPTTKAKK